MKIGNIKLIRLLFILIAILLWCFIFWGGNKVYRNMVEINDHLKIEQKYNEMDTH